jgi:HNH endonuclease
MATPRHQITTGDQFGDLTVVALSRVAPDGVYWLCRCRVCGTERSAVASRLVRGKFTRCGPRHFTDEQRFWNKLAPANEGGCRVYRGARTGGYGIHSWQGRAIRASRLAWQLTHGPIPASMQVCHHCDNPPCCEPSHLFLGTTQDNTQDREQKDRGPQGRRNPRARLTVGQVREARRLYRAGDATGAELAVRYGLSRGGMYQVLSGRRWPNA